MKPCWILLLGTPLLCARSSAQQTWTVSPDGSADFKTVNEALPIVGEGDVLLVEPGLYPPFHAHKSLSILGPAAGPAPSFLGLTSIEDAAHVALAGLQFERLLLRRIPGRAQIDACSFGAPGLLAVTRLTIEACDAVALSRIRVVGSGGAWAPSTEPAAMRAMHSTLTLDECTIRGGNGQTAKQNGTLALSIDDCSLALAAVSLIGGSGGQGGGLCSYCHGLGGDGLRANDSTIVIRGTSASVVKPGQWTWDGALGFAYGLNATNCSVVASGVTIASQHLVGSSFVLAAPEEPFATLQGSDVSGNARRLLLYGPAGALGVVASALAPGLSQTPTLEGLLWLDPSAIVGVHAMVTQGPSTPTTWLIDVPPLSGLAGVTIWMQAGFPGVQGTLDPAAFALANPVQLLLRH